MSSFRTLDNADLNNKRVLLRVDINVPMENGVVTDATRIERVATTITEIADKGGKVIVLAHFGRPKGRDEKDSLKPVAAALSQIIKRPVAFADDCIGDLAVLHRHVDIDAQQDALVVQIGIVEGTERTHDAMLGTPSPFETRRFAALLRVRAE